MIKIWMLGIFFLTTFFVCDGQELNFLVLGDWGGSSHYPYKTKIEEQTSKQMAYTASKTDSQFIVALGDNFYDNGVRNEFDHRFEETFVNVYNAASLQIPWYVIGGNHDHYGNISGQIAYSKHSKHWTFPGLWHAHKFVIPGTNRTLKIVLLDTVILCGNTNYDEEHLQPEGPEDFNLAEKQWSWLDDQLHYSKDDYLIVGGHFPVWSIAEHGPTKCLVERLRPMLNKYHVNSYICGHDHNLQYLREDNSFVHYFLIGAADKIEYNKSHKRSVPPNSSKFFWADMLRYGGFAHVKVTEGNLQFNLIDSLGKTLLTQNIAPRN